MRLIDADTLQRDLEISPFNDYDDFLRTERLIDDAPTVEPKWIPITERLPKDDEDVLVTYIGAFQCSIVTTAYLYEERLYKNRPTFFSTSGVSLEKVVAWMPLLEPYKEGD